MRELKIGDPAPAFSLPATNGKTVSLKDFRGSTVVIYFYPKDDTPGCTTEACSFRDSIKTFADRGVVVLGVSPDGMARHENFSEKFGLPFLLLSDEKKLVCQAYGVWIKKMNCGKEYLGVARTTFIINGKGKITHIFPKVKPDGHAAEILAAILP